MRGSSRDGWVAAIVLLAASACLPPRPMAAGQPTGRVVRQALGRTGEGDVVEQYVLTNARGLEVAVMTYGATLRWVRTPDREGRLAPITLYLDSLEDYLRGHPLFGSVVGRYANRIAGAALVLDGVRYQLTANAGPNHIHGGRRGFQKRVWRAGPTTDGEGAGVEMRLTSPDGDEGYPGELHVRMRYVLTDDNQLRMEYWATTDKPTHVNLTNHAYWNLSGAGSGDVLSHLLTLNADYYLPTDARKIPTGEMRPVAGTPMDFRQPHAVGERIKQVEGENYDHCYVLNKPAGGERLSFCARVADPASGRVMEVWTTQPGVQLYTARGLSDRFRAGGKPYGAYHGLCLETQHYPDSPNKPHFPSTVLRPGDVYHELTIHRFGVMAPRPNAAID